MTKVSDYNYCSSPRGAGESIIQPFEGCSHETPCTVAQQRGGRRRNHFNCRSAFADSYTIYDLGDANARDVFGMDTAGAVVIFQESCGKFGPSCYMTYTNGLVTNESSTAPDLT